MTTQTKLRKFDVDEYYAMAEAGILSEENDRVELLDGEIYEKYTNADGACSTWTSTTRWPRPAFCPKTTASSFWTER